MRSLHKALLAASASLAVAAAIWATVPSSARPRPLAAGLPPGPLLTIETPDFAGLLQRWNASPEQTAWLKSANYSAFTNSHLFGRLSDAQSEFEGAAGGKRGFDAEFLKQVAGKESIFAWYDISKLEFLYISHLAPGKTAQVELLQQRGKFLRRESGGTSFYIRTSLPSSNETADAAGPSTPRTVGFATRGDWLILATREDLIANALLLMESTDVKAPSAATDGWYAAAEAAGAKQHGELHMLLDLQRITSTAAFRTHWIQRNVTATARYRAAVVDLYPEAAAFREERVLLPDGASGEDDQTDLGGLEALVPERAGVFRAWALPTADESLRALDEKVLTRSTTSSVRDTSALAADLSIPRAGSSTDLDTRIDAVSAAPEPAGTAERPLLQMLQDAQLVSMLTIDRTDPTVRLFVPIHSAVVLRSKQAWDSAKLQAALLTAMRAHLTVAGLGLVWSPEKGYLTLGSTTPLALFVEGNNAILANDSSLMEDVLARRSASGATQRATLIAGFQHSQERPAFVWLSRSLAPAHASGPRDGDSAGQAPDFFAGSVASLSEAFQRLSSERMIEHGDGALMRQTVTYTWQTR